MLVADGELLRLARCSGHSGRLCGLDPADAMIDQLGSRGMLSGFLETFRRLVGSGSSI